MQDIKFKNKFRDNSEKFTDNKNRIILGVSLLVLVPAFALGIWNYFKSEGESDLEKNLKDKTVQSAISKQVAAALDTASNKKPSPDYTPAPPAKSNDAPPSNSIPAPPDNTAKDEEREPIKEEAQDNAEEKEFKNEDLDVSFNYPKDYEVSADSKQITISKGDVSWKLRFYENKDKEEIETWFKGHFDEEDNLNCLFSGPEIKVGSYDGKLVKPDSEEGKCDDEGNYALSSDKEKIVKVVQGDETIDNIKKILESFKFL